MFQLLGLAVVELLNVAMLVVVHLHQALDLRFEADHLLLTWHRGLDRERKTRLVTGTLKVTLDLKGRMSRICQLWFVNTKMSLPINP